MNCNLQDHLCSLQMLVRKGMGWGLHFPLSDFSLIVELEGVGVEGQDFGFLFVLPPFPWSRAEEEPKFRGGVTLAKGGGDRRRGCC